MASSVVIKKIAKISKITGFTKLCYFLNKDRKRTIAYHNVIPDKYWDNSLHLSHSMKESSFKKQLEIIENKFGFTLDIEDKSKVTLTFDDGYLNQYSVASKIMDNKNIKGYFFCTANLINNNEVLIMDRLQYWFSYVPYGIYNIDEVNIQLEINNKNDRSNEWKKINDIIGKFKIEKIEELLNRAYPFSEIDIDKYFYNLRFESIKNNQLNEMKNIGHKIGAHSANHKRLSNMSIKELEEDISICSNMLKKIYNTDIFCYPFGSKEDINECVVNIIKNKGFIKAFAYSNGYIEEGYNDYFIPRMFLPDEDDKDIIEFVLSGAKHFLSYRKLLPKY